MSTDVDLPYRGGFVGPEHHFALAVYFEDTDAYGVVYYANYLKYMERARSDMIRAAGVDQFAEMRESGSAYIVVDVAIKYRAPARLGDEILVASTVQEVRASSVRIQQRVMRGDQLLTEALVTAAFLDAGGRPRRQPKDWVEKFKGIALSPSSKLLFRIVALAAAAGATPATAQTAIPVIAVPPLSTPDDKPTKVGSTLSLAWQATQMIGNDLRTTAELLALPSDQKDFYSYPEVTAPSYPKWRARGAKALLTGFVQLRGDGRLTVGCYVYDVEKGRELGRTGFVVAPEDMRRAAHRCSGLAYKSLVGAPGVFDTRLAYVAKSGSGTAEVSRVAIMDSDGFNHEYVTSGDTLVMTPRLSSDAERLAYVSYAGGRPSVQVVDLASDAQRPLIAGEVTTFAPRFSPDGRRILFSMNVAGNTDIFVVNAGGGAPQRLTTAPGTDTSASFSPDGSAILFESDRSGTQQLYVMRDDGSDQRRISFGGGWYAGPAWSPDGERVAFTRRTIGALRVGTMNADGSDEHLLSSGPRDEGVSWAASSRELIFQRTDPAGRVGLYRANLAGGEPRKFVTPQDGADPDWSGVRN